MFHRRGESLALQHFDERGGQERRDDDYTFPGFQAIHPSTDERKRLLAARQQRPDIEVYFPTPPIFAQEAGIYSKARFLRFFEFYVDAFYSLCAFLVQQSPGNIAAFYPSSVAVESHPPGMTEYAMAKAAGESLCADLNARWSQLRITVNRIPRVRTDQTAGLLQIESAEPANVMLPIVRQVQTAV